MHTFLMFVLVTQASAQPAESAIQRLQSKADLHLFPDGTYIYCEWADVESNAADASVYLNSLFVSVGKRTCNSQPLPSSKTGGNNWLQY